MFQSQIAFPVTANWLADMGNETHAMWKAPFAGEVIDLWAVAGAAVTQDGTVGLSIILQNGGAVGTATTAIGTVGGGTTDAGWVADTVRAGTLGVATFAAGDVLAIQYDETGTYNPAWLNVGFNVRYGTS